jgi:signal transduction histidine kinase
MHKMQRTEQLVVVGELAAGLAHEIKNPLAGIKVAMQVLSEEASLSEEDRGVVKKVGQEVVRLESLMKNFLNFAKPAKPQLTGLNVNSLMNTILAFYVKSRPGTPDRPNAVIIAKELQPVPETMADPMQLQQIFLNIVLNAVDAMPKGGRLGVRTSFEAGPGLIHIEISDTGNGISKEHADKIFHPFFTTKPKGTGLGLAISKQLIEQHGGSIAAAANPSGGTVFRIELPLISPMAAPVA